MPFRPNPGLGLQPLDRDLQGVHPQCQLRHPHGHFCLCSVLPLGLPSGCLQRTAIRLDGAQHDAEQYRLHAPWNLAPRGEYTFRVMARRREVRLFNVSTVYDERLNVPNLSNPLVIFFSPRRSTTSNLLWSTLRSRRTQLPPPLPSLQAAQPPRRRSDSAPGPRTSMSASLS